MKQLFLIIFLALFSLTGFAKSESSIGGFFGSVSATQSTMNSVINNANSRETITTSGLTSGLEFAFHITFRVSKSIALQFRPSYFLSEEKGSDGSGNSYNYSVTGFTFFPVLRWYMLEDKFIKFFTQFGLGYGQANGKITEASASVEFSSGNMGFKTGLGAEFCFSKGAHCVVLEGNYRYLPFVRNVASGVSGTFSSTNPSSIDQPTNGGEVEFNNSDLATTFSGIIGNLGYSYYF